MLTSCSIDQVKDLNPGREIEFRVVTTKGGVLTMHNFETFKLVAFMEDGTLYYEDTYEFNGERFVTPEKHLWPTDGTNLKFYAYCQYGAQPSGNENTSEGGLILEDFTPDIDISKQVDLVHAIASGNINSTGSVELDFRHSLSQIELRGKNVNPNYRFEVLGLRIANVASVADFNVQDCSFESSGSTVYEILYDTPRTLGSQPVSLMKAEDDNAFLIPQELLPWSPHSDPTNENGHTYLALKVKITTADTGSKVYPVLDVECDWIALPIDGIWEAGYKYTYIWELSTATGYIDPNKDPDAIDIVFFPAGAPVMGSQITVLSPTVYDWSGEEVVPSRLGVWTVDRMTLTATKGDNESQVLEMPSPKAVSGLGFLPDLLHKVNAASNEYFYLNGSDTPSTTFYQDGVLCFKLDSDIIEVKKWTETKMSLYFKYIPQEDVMIEYEAHYIKEGSSRMLRDWEELINGEWRVNSYKRSVVMESGEELEEEGLLLDSYEEIVNAQDIVSEWFHVLTFINPYEWYFNNHFKDNSYEHVINYTLLLNDKISLFINIDQDNYEMMSLYDVELMSASEMKVYASSQYVKDGSVGTEYIEMSYIKT